MSKNQLSAVYDTGLKKVFPNIEKCFEERQFSKAQRNTAREIVDKKTAAANAHHYPSIAMLITLTGRDITEDNLKRSITVMETSLVEAQFKEKTQQEKKSYIWKNEY